jgi:hypothetical protein
MTPPPPFDEPTYANSTAPTRRHRQERKLPKALPTKTRHDRPSHQHGTRANKRHLAATAIATPDLDLPLPFSDHHALHGNAFKPDTGQLAEYIELSQCSEGTLWIESCKDEFGPLCQGHGTDMPPGDTEWP